MRVLRHAAADKGVGGEVDGCWLACLARRDVGDGSGGDEAQGCGGEEDGEAGHCFCCFILSLWGEARGFGLTCRL